MPEDHNSHRKNRTCCPTPQPEEALVKNLIDLYYRNRSLCEQHIKDVKDQGLSKLLLKRFGANHIWCLIVALSHQLLASTKITHMRKQTNRGGHGSQKLSVRGLLRLLQKSPPVADDYSSTSISTTLTPTPWSG